MAKNCKIVFNYLSNNLVNLFVFAGVALVDDYIFAVGGFDRSRRLDTVERFDPRANRWQFVASLRVALSCASVVAYRSHLYVFGGTVSDTAETTNLVFRYDPKSNTWSDLARMPSPRSGCSVCVGPSGLIYVVGRFDYDSMNNYD